MKKTKIICTIGPASESPEVLEQLIKAGMNVMRLNFSHGDHAEHLEKVKTLRALNEKLGTNVAFMLDTKGPEIRTGSFGTDQKTTMSFEKGDKLNTIDISGVAEILNNIGDRIKDIEVYFNPRTTKLVSGIKGEKLYDIITQKEV